MLHFSVRSIDPQGLPARSLRGFTLVEIGAAGALLGTVMMVLIPVLSRTTGLREQVDRREEACSAVANLLERVALIPAPTTESLQPIADQLTSDLRLTSPQWQIVVTPEDNPAMQRVEATLSWQTHSANRSAVTLVRWYSRRTP